MRGIYTKILNSVAQMARQACYDSSGMASRASMYEPEMKEDVKAWRKEHKSFMEKLARKIGK